MRKFQNPLKPQRRKIKMGLETKNSNNNKKNGNHGSKISSRVYRGDRKKKGKSKPAQYLELFANECDLSSSRIVKSAEELMNYKFCCAKESCFKKMLEAGKEENKFKASNKHSFLSQDMENAAHVVRECRQKVRKYEGFEKDTFIKHTYETGLYKRDERGRLRNVWMIPGYTTPICRPTWAKVYDISIYKMDSVAKGIKDGIFRSASTITWTDSHIHDFTFGDTFNMLSELYDVQGKQMGKDLYFSIFIIIDIILYVLHSYPTN